MYLTAMIDWYSRMIVGWNLSDTLDTGYVIQAVKDAVAAHGTPAILNSDQGCQFTSNAYKTLLRELRIRQSIYASSCWGTSSGRTSFSGISSCFLKLRNSNWRALMM